MHVAHVITDKLTKGVGVNVGVKKVQLARRSIRVAFLSSHQRL